MCPGGFVVNSSIEDNHMIINGMSYNKRNSEKKLANKNRLKAFFFYLIFHLNNLLNLSIASTVFSLEPNEVNLKYPSPFFPKPEPGVPTI